MDAVDDLSGSEGDGVEVDWAFKDAESVEEDGKDEGRETLHMITHDAVITHDATAM